MDRSVTTTIRAIDGRARADVELVASRMRETLVEVLGQERGGSMYSHEWLIDRVLFHVQNGVVFVAERDEVIVGHAMARVEDGVGHFSTIFVSGPFRRQGMALLLLRRVEAWFIERGLPQARYYTDEGNVKLITLFGSQGYAITETDAVARMVKLRKQLLAV